MRSFFALAWVWGLWACAPGRGAGPLPAERPPAPLERWVDARATPGGDGSRARPLKALGEALAVREGRPLVVHLASGLYPGPFELPDGSTLRGQGAVVLHAEDGAATVLTARGRVTLERLMVQGGAVGLDASGEVELVEVKLSGQRRSAVRVAAGALEARGCELEGTVSETLGLEVGAARVVVEATSFSGAFRRAVAVNGGRARIRASRFSGPATGVHQVGGEVELRGLTLSGGRGPAIFTAGGALRARDVSVFGHEYGLQTGQGARLEVSDFTSVRPARASIALVQSSGRLSDVVALESGNFGGVQLVGSDVTVERLRVHGATAYGLFARLGSLKLNGAVLTSIRAERSRGQESGGDGLSLYGTAARLEEVSVRDAEGSGLLALAEASVAARELSCEGCRFGGLLVDTGSRVDVVGLRVERTSGAAVVVPGAARVRVELLSVEGAAEGAVWAECGQGARVELGRVRGPPARGGPCVGALTRPLLLEGR